MPPHRHPEPAHDSHKTVPAASPTMVADSHSRLALLGTIASIVVIVATVVIGYKTVSVSNAQYRVMKTQVQPDFSSTSSDSGQSQNGWSASFDLTNTGFRANSISCKAYMSLDVPVYSRIPFHLMAYVLIPMEGGVYCGLNSTSGIGKFASVWTTFTNDLSGACNSAQAKLTGSDFDGKIVTVFMIFANFIVDIKYTDALGDTHEVFYYVGGSTCGQLSNSYGAQIIDEYRAKVRAGAYCNTYEWSTKPARMTKDIVAAFWNENRMFRDTEMVWKPMCAYNQGVSLSPCEWQVSTR